MRGRFLSPLRTEHVGAHRKRLISDLLYEDARGRVFTVRAGFECDGASVPRFLWSLYPPFGELYEPAAWLHDHLYAAADRVRVFDAAGALRSINRREADALMREASLACGFRGLGAAVMYVGVRLGGWLPWSRYRRAQRAVAV